MKLSYFVALGALCSLLNGSKVFAACRPGDKPLPGYANACMRSLNPDGLNCPPNYYKNEAADRQLLSTHLLGYGQRLCYICEEGYKWDKHSYKCSK